MKISELFRYMPGISFAGDCEVTGITNDSRTAAPGNIFFALKGSRTDGNRYIAAALGKGVCAVISDSALPEEITAAYPDRCFYRAEDMNAVMSSVSAAFYGNPSSAMRVIGLTGTKGKTTVSYILEKIMTRAGRHPGLIGTIGCRLDGAPFASTCNTTPLAHTLHSLLAAMRSGGADTAVLEISSHALSLKRAEDLMLDTAVFLNLQSDHLDFHKDLESYFLAKAHIFDILGKSCKKDKAAVINADDGKADRLLASLEAAGLKYYTFGVEEAADFRAENVRIGAEATCFGLKGPCFSGNVNLKLFGKYNVYNALAAIAAAYACGVDVGTAVKGAEDTVNIPGRLEPVDRGQDFKVFVDYAHTAAALENVLANLKLLPHRRIITVFGCGGDRDRTKRAPMGAAACSMSDRVIITDDNPRTEDPDAIIGDIEGGIKGRFTDYSIIKDRGTAIRTAISEASGGDIVLIAGKGHENYQLLNSGRIYFSDKETAEKALCERSL